jgi:rhodanese-related sulfurtransferase
MPFTPQDQASSREYFRQKLAFEKQKFDVVQKVTKGVGPDFVLIDTRTRGVYAEGHIPGALCMPAEEVADLCSQLPPPGDADLVVYCTDHF